MKLNLLILIPLLSSCTLSAQLAITPGAQFSASGFIQVTLQNTDLINNGTFLAGNSTFSFRGNAASSISGTQPVRFNELEIDKVNNSSVILNRTITVDQRVLFTSGFLDLNGFDTDLGTTGHLDGEEENKRVIGPNGGAILFSVNLNSPTNSNPANLGVFITSGQDLGIVVIRRGHQSQFGSGLVNSIFRYYDIVPTNNNNLNATLRFRYLDGELNGFDENSLEFFQSTNNTNWSNLGFNSRDVTANFVEKNSINSFGRFTLSNPGNPLPVRYVLFNGRCEDGKMLISWKTSQEQNSSHFNIERSANGTNWNVIGNLPAAGNSTIERSYSFTDNNPVQNGLYRIAQYDRDGKVYYTSILRSSCKVSDVFSVWPNPVRDRVFINIVASSESHATISLFDSKGALVKSQKETVLQGSNQVSINMQSLANGVYSLTIDLNNGQIKKAVQVLKR